MRFEWDAEKAERNARLHGVTFEEATEVFVPGNDVLEVYDVEHSESGDRFKTIGPIRRGLVLVVWTERDEDVVRIISVWWATKAEQEAYRDFMEGKL